MNISDRRRRVAQVLAVALAVVGVSACGSDNGGDGPADETISELVVASAAPLSSLDVTKALNSFTVGSLAYELLEYSRPDGSYVPGMASSVSVKPKEIRYEIREAQFSDGSPVTPEDVEFTIERAVTAPTTGPLLRSVESVDVTGASEVTVTLSAADGTVRGALSVVSGVLKQSYVESNPDDFGSGDKLGPASGPYEAVELDASGVEFVKNSEYWGEAPNVEKVTYQFIADPNAAQLAMRSGEIDAAILLDPGNADQYEFIDGASIYTDSGAITSFFSFDVTAPPFDDVHVRRAIAHAVDRENLVEVAFNGYADPLRSLLSHNQLTTVSDADTAEQFLEELPQLEFDMDAAKEELSMSAYPDGFEVTVPTAPIVGFGETTLLALQENLRELGIELKIDTLSAEQWTAQLYAHEDLGMQLAFLTPAVNDPAGVLGLLVGEANAVANGFNVANYTPSGVEDALGVLLASDDVEERYAATTTILEAIAEDVPYVPLVTPQFVLVTGPGTEYAPEDPTTADIASGLWIRGIRGAT